ncbi:MAG: Chemotaxis protein histidine kinase [Frankiales bacterium]|nr:Chemotaxis protein histidine kinase [Frankiales bacterium]
MNEMDEIVQEFLVESHENLDQLDTDLIALEQDPTSRDLLGSVFRTIHTIKGTSGFLAYNKLEAVTHVGENLLSRLRDGELVLTPEITSALLQMVDAVRGLLGSIERDGTEGDPDHTLLIETLTRLQVTTPEQRTSPEVLEVEPVPAPKIGEVLVESGATTTDDVVAAVVEQRLGDDRRLGEILVQQGTVQATDVEHALEAQADPRRSVADSSIRVDVDLLDALMNLVGELVLTRNQIVQHASTREDTDLVRSSQRLNLIASELQEGVMKTRMQPIDNIWQKVPRVVRDLSLTCGKTVRVEMEGKETELDRTILEATKDPLTHLVRNAVDHAIETPEVRVAAGKPAEGLLLLRAYHEGGQVNIEITDDGKGIDPVVIGAKAVEKGLVTAEQLARMGTREITGLIFAPGFSTAAAVTNVSGRGVGMDVVKTNIEKIGGTIDVQSRVGHGTTFRIKIPLTLAIIPALTVTCAGDRYAIPQVNLLELVRLEGEGLQGIEQIHGAPVYRLRGNLLPLVYLDRELGVGPGQLDRTRDVVYIVVLQAEERQFGLVVDDVCDTEEIVVKPLGKQLKGIPCFAGATILGDGRVALILDVLALAQQANVLTAGRDRALVERNARGDAAASDVQALLVVKLGEDRRMAIPLAMVTRLEEFPVSTVEHVGSREVVQYRGQILPLIRLSTFLGAGWSEQAADANLQVVVYSEAGRSVGLVVDAILDIAEESLAATSDLDDHGLLGSAVVQQHITEMLDVRSAILAADPHFYDETAGVLA